MNRRTLLAALPGAAVAPGAALAETETPVETLFRKWFTAWSEVEDLCQSDEWSEEDEDFHAASAQMIELEGEIMAARKSSIADVALAVAAVSNFGTVAYGDEFFRAILSDARLLAG